MKEKARQWAFPGVVIVVALLYLCASVASGVAGGDEEYPMNVVEKLMIGLLTGGAAVMLLAGLWANKRSARMSGGLMVASAIAVGLAMWWTIVVPVVAFSLAIFGVRRARRFARERISVA